MIGYIQHGSEAVIDGRKGGVHHHADRGEGLDDALDGLEGAATAFLCLLDKPTGRHVFTTGLAEAAVAQAPTEPPSHAIATTVGAVGAVCSAVEAGATIGVV